MSTPSQSSSELDPATDEREDAARRYVEQLRAFYVHAGVFAAGMLVIFTVNLLTNAEHTDSEREQDVNTTRTDGCPREQTRLLVRSAHGAPDQD
jgi:hypothetical protein